jgi:hypothetical protein
VSFRLPAAAGASGAVLRVNGRTANRVRVAGRTAIARVGAGALRSLSVVAPAAGKAGGSVRVTLRGRGRQLGTLQIPIR